MPARPMNRIVQHLRTAVLARDGGGLTDGQLLQRFIQSRDEAAFAALVRRHGPMVLGVCRRVTGNVHDAEDAFQAAFLVLARKAATVVPRDAVGNWLHGVSYRTALKARSAANRRRAREREVEVMPERAVTDPCDDELHTLLDQELGRLPEKYRLPIVLCGLEGRTRKEVARQLRLPEGTLSSRLAAGRKMLARRLARRGLALSAGALAAALSESSAAALPPFLLLPTVKTATLSSGAGAVAGTVPAKAAALAQGVMKTMLLTKLGIGAGVLAVALVGVSVAGFGRPAPVWDPGHQAAEANEPKAGKPMSERTPAAEPSLPEPDDLERPKGAGKTPAEKVQWRDDYRAARAEAREEKLPLFLYFHLSKSCPFCRRLEAETFRDPEIVRLLNRKFIPLKIDAHRQVALTEALRVGSFPTLVLAAPDGKILARIEGFQEPAALKGRLVDALHDLSGAKEKKTRSRELPEVPTSATIKWRWDYNAARQEAWERERPLILYFFAENAVWCTKLEETTFRDSGIARMVSRKFVPLKIDAARNAELADSLHIERFPTLVVAGPDGKILDTIEGYRDAAALKRRLEHANDHSASRERSDAPP